MQKGDSVQPYNLTLRIPFWTHSEGAKASLNGQHLALPSPGLNFHLIYIDTVSLILFKRKKLKDRCTFILRKQRFRVIWYIWLLHSGNYLTLARKWSTGDQINLELPVKLRTDPIQGIFVPSYIYIYIYGDWRYPLCI